MRAPKYGRYTSSLPQYSAYRFLLKANRCKVFDQVYWENSERPITQVPQTESQIKVLFVSYLLLPYVTLDHFHAINYARLYSSCLQAGHSHGHGDARINLWISCSFLRLGFSRRHDCCLWWAFRWRRLQHPVYRRHIALSAAYACGA
jgi:hypothetical protein